jgi:hypothetical protein
MKRQFVYIVLVLALAAAALSACDQVLGGATPTATPAGSIGEGKIVTLADDGQTVTMHVGESFLLKLGTAYDWTVIPLDQDIIRREPNVLTVIGSQGLYQAHKVGRTQITATGDPPCRQSQPPCAMPSRGFLLDVVVE